MYVVEGMWQLTQSALRESSAVWKWWRGVRYRSAAWQPRQTWLPGARSRPLCGSRQSEHVTPRAYIFDCRNEPYS